MADMDITHYITDITRNLHQPATRIIQHFIFSPGFSVTPATARQLRTHIIKEIEHWVLTADTKSPFIKYFQLAITFISGHDHNFEVMMKLVRKKHSSSDCGKAVRPSEWWEGQSRVLRRDWNVKMVWIRARPQICITLSNVDTFQLYL